MAQKKLNSFFVDTREASTSESPSQNLQVFAWCEFKGKRFETMVSGLPTLLILRVPSWPPVFHYYIPILTSFFANIIAVLLEVDLKHLPKLMLSLPDVTSSCNASAECIFSMVKTDSLHNSTLSALVNFDRYCYEQESGAELLWLSKSAT